MNDEWPIWRGEDRANRAGSFDPTRGSRQVQTPAQEKEQRPWIQIMVCDRQGIPLGGVQVAVTGGGLSQVATTSTSWDNYGQVTLYAPSAGPCTIDLPGIKIWEDIRWIGEKEPFGGTDEALIRLRGKSMASGFFQVVPVGTQAQAPITLRILRSRDEVPQSDMNGILSPWKCFKTFRHGIGYEIQGGTDCAHYVAHILGMKGPGCIDGFVTYVPTLLQSCKPDPVIWNQVEVDDVWTPDPAEHVGIVSEVIVVQENPRVVSRVTVNQGGRPTKDIFDQAGKMLVDARRNYPPGGGIRQIIFVPLGVPTSPGIETFYGQFFRKRS